WDVVGLKEVRVLNAPREGDPDDRGFPLSSKAGLNRSEQPLYSSDGKRLAAIVTDAKSGLRTLKVWDAGGKELNKVKLTRRITSSFAASLPTGYTFAFSPDGKLLAWSSPEGIIHLEDAATGKPRRYVKSDVGCQIAFTPDGKHLLALTPATEQVQRWEVETG